MSKSDSNNNLKITLAGLPRVVATWDYATENSECSLCRVNLMNPVAVSDQNKTTYVGNIIIGTCQHGFHDPCITHWIKSGNMNCPKCFVPWKINKNVSSGVYVYNSTA